MFSKSWPKSLAKRLLPKTYIDRSASSYGFWNKPLWRMWAQHSLLFACMYFAEIHLYLTFILHTLLKPGLAKSELLIFPPGSPLPSVLLSIADPSLQIALLFIIERPGLNLLFPPLLTFLLFLKIKSSCCQLLNLTKSRSFLSIDWAHPFGSLIWSHLDYYNVLPVPPLYLLFLLFIWLLDIFSAQKYDHLPFYYFLFIGCPLISVPNLRFCY